MSVPFRVTKVQKLDNGGGWITLIVVNAIKSNTLNTRFYVYFTTIKLDYTEDCTTLY